MKIYIAMDNTTGVVYGFEAKNYKKAKRILSKIRRTNEELTNAKWMPKQRRDKWIEKYYAS